MSNEMWLILGAGAGNFLLLLWGYFRSGKRFEAHYMVDAFVATAGSWPTIQSIGFMPSPETVWWKVALAGLAFGLGLKVLVGKMLVRPVVKKLAK